MLAPASTDRVRLNLRVRLHDVVRRRNGLRQQREELVSRLAQVHEAFEDAGREEQAVRAELEFHASRQVP